MVAAPRPSARALLVLACSAAAVAGHASVGASQSRPPRSTRLHDVAERVVLRLERLEFRCAEQVPPTCGLSAGSDLAVLSLSVQNHGASAYEGHLYALSLLGAPPAGATQPELFAPLEPAPGACAPAARARELIEPGGELRLEAGRARRFEVMFEIPRGASLARALYHDDDFPTCLSLPAVSYSGPACRPHGRRPSTDIACNFFER